MGCKKYVGPQNVALAIFCVAKSPDSSGNGDKAKAVTEGTEGLGIPRLLKFASHPMTAVASTSQRTSGE